MKKIVLLASAFALLFLNSCSNKKEEKEEKVSYVVTNAAQIDTTFTKEYVSQIRSVKNIELRAQEKGYLQNIYVDEGQFVTTGQVLFKIMPKVYEAELLRAQAEAKAAEIEWQNAKNLADKNIVSKNEQAIAQAKFDRAKAEVALAKLHLSFTEIRAPFSGTIDRIPKKLGSLIDEGELLTSLSDNSKVYAYFNVTEPEYLDYQTNIKGRGSNTVTLVLANNQPFKYKGKVEVIESEFNNETGNIAFRASFPNSDKLLKNGQTGKVQLTVPLRNALVIPQKSTYEIQDKQYVFVVDAKNVVQSREVTITGALPDLYVVNGGITASDKIILEGVQKAKDNDKITYTFQKPEDVLAHLRLKAE
ncbi:MAG: efflux RND transporter periplasmic adaptor subunit [Flavobacterium sp.]|nr:efflux RND transporter periplasmic adaptor subunit [Flavobacterium sp.]